MSELELLHCTLCTRGQMKFIFELLFACFLVATSSLRTGMQRKLRNSEMALLLKLLDLAAIYPKTGPLSQHLFSSRPLFVLKETPCMFAILLLVEYA